MDCPKCGRFNLEGKKVCGDCGAALSFRCPACGADNPKGKNFCGDCGAALTPTVLPQVTAAAGASTSITSRVTERSSLSPVPSSSAERRQLTVMFCDLVGSTALATKLDPEDLRDIIAKYRDSVAAVVRKYGGTISRYIGDGMLILFGHPSAHEDDAERSVRAALEIAATRHSPGGPPEFELRVRLGLATGLVIVGDLIGSEAAETQAVLGETPNLAARLQALAEPDGVVIAEDTRRLIGGLFDYENLGAVTLKGFAAPVQAWRVLHEGTAESRFEALHPSMLAPLVGREEELARLERSWDLAKADSGQVVLLVGEAGIGKSRLVAALQERIEREPHTFLRYFCSPHHQESALYPFTAQLQRAAGFDREDAPTVKLKKLRLLLSPALPSDEDVAILAELLSIPSGDLYLPVAATPQQKKERSFAALVRQLEVLAEKHPVMVVFEDMQWIDPSSRELLDRTVDRVASLPVLVLITYRPELQLVWSGKPHVSLLVMNRLDQKAGATLIRSVAGSRTLPTEIVNEIAERTDGVPLFVEELTKAVLETSNEGIPRAISFAPLPGLAVPATLHASLMARLDRVGPIAKEVAQIGAAIGREFSYDLLAAVVQRCDNELQAALDRLINAELMFGRGEPPDANFLFKHALIQDAAYGTLLRSQRRELHARIVDALEERLYKGIQERPEILAHHCTHAGLIEKAVSYWQEAGERSKARSAMTEAIAQMRKALDLLSHLPDTAGRQGIEADLQLALGGALIAAKGHAAEETGKAYARARRLCELLNDRPNLLKTLWGQFVHYHVRGETDRSHRIAEELLDLAGRQNDAAILVAGHRAVGDSCLHRGQLALARVHLERGLALYDPSQQRSLTALFAENARVAMLSFLSLTYSLLGFPDQALVQSSEAISEARGSSHPISLAFALSVACRLHFVLDDAGMVAQLAEELVALTSEQRFAFFLAMGTAYRGWTLAEAGDAEAGVDLLRHGIEGFQASGAAWTLPFYLAQLAAAEAKRARFETGLGQLSDALVLTQKLGVRWFEAELHRRRGDLMLTARPDAEAEAETEFRRSIAIARQQEAKLWEVRSAVTLARLWRRQGKGDEARDLLAPVYDWFDEGFDVRDLKDSKALLEELCT
ncbi:class 3 adenylate cyclase/predicted ATPase/energy-coupling factor transporter ATP-binding protein EcfA2 [Bradyrhizobium sp. CIR48]|uniref:adenylate/guanylate cyclase domain-containing protein n=1 Tax=unclassified Bradyrhizobium TaxID=2631580 RepID=UPI00160573C0|nr:MULTISPECIES: adenylate/guanylate cyclase domain-containing protein [unclassified Bradyrhizobium]MBB4366159.1 class 3 adenylate cyclase/predicted ATPase/energy-coupling factor transporter ATP-binding protein EcfA2 [Bradyrhizobium sp. CIR18]MBB4429331.1 class 3 adenylate cyclase/predicted ATPase/energy-coupling factor transporter ATP-binding protein EcfA2 [Bradyrhizobium sp. CIR48]